jgi:uncharacterized protein
MLDQFLRQNRWWADPSAIYSDRHLVRMREAALSWTPPLPFRTDRDCIYVLRGARQVGKSTVMKRQISELLAAGWAPRRILYLDAELAGLETGRDLVGALRTYLDSERSSTQEASTRCAVFLDEVTRVQNWSGALRGLVDNDELKGVTVVATGSHMRDLRQGGERLPGRRGEGSDLDWVLRPLSFREYVTLVDPEVGIPASLGLLTADGVRSGMLARGHLRPRLIALFEKYLATGGFLTAINDVARSGGVKAETYQTYRDAIVGEFTRAGMRESFLREVVNWLASHLGKEFDFRDIAADTDIGSKDTARNYMDNLEASYVTTIVYRASSLSRPAPAFRGPKRVHPVDPLFWHLVNAWASNDPDPWLASLAALENLVQVGHLVESTVASHLARAFGDRVFYWRPSSLQEVDFVVAPPNAPPMLLEVKYQQSIGVQDVGPLTRAGGGLLATRSFNGDVADGSVCAVPVAELLALMHTPSLAPCLS